MVVQSDATKWDYKHQMPAMTQMPPWRLLLGVKFIEASAELAHAHLSDYSGIPT
jgi:anaerobic magnesium-protoporphyrin IX monomethyl ester cyclase